MCVCSWPCNECHTNSNNAAFLTQVLRPVGSSLGTHLTCVNYRSQDGGCTWFWTQCPCALVAVDPLRGCCARLAPEHTQKKGTMLLLSQQILATDECTVALRAKSVGASPPLTSCPFALCSGQYAFYMRISATTACRVHRRTLQKSPCVYLTQNAPQTIPETYTCTLPPLAYPPPLAFSCLPPRGAQWSSH